METIVIPMNGCPSVLLTCLSLSVTRSSCSAAQELTAEQLEDLLPSCNLGINFVFFSISKSTVIYQVHNLVLPLLFLLFVMHTDDFKMVYFVPNGGYWYSYSNCSIHNWNHGCELVAASKKMKAAKQEADNVEAMEGLDTLANLAILGENEALTTSSQATTKHPRHRPGCSCIVCIQPPSGKGPKHKQQE